MMPRATEPVPEDNDKDAAIRAERAAAAAVDFDWINKEANKPIVVSGDLHLVYIQFHQPKLAFAKCAVQAGGECIY
jgi:hypothetical protein